MFSRLDKSGVSRVVPTCGVSGAALTDVTPTPIDSTTSAIAMDSILMLCIYFQSSSMRYLRIYRARTELQTGENASQFENIRFREYRISIFARSIYR